MPSYGVLRGVYHGARIRATRWLATTRSSAITLFRGLLERSQHHIAPRHGVVERFLGRLLSRKRGLDFLGPDVTHLHHVTKAQAAGILRRLLVGQFLKRRFRYRILFIE